MEKEDLEVEQVYNYIKKKRDASASEMERELMLSKIVVSNSICFLLGAKKIELHRVVGKSKLYKINKQVIKDER